MCDFRTSSYSFSNGNCVEVGVDMNWRKSKHSNPNGACVEVADEARTVLVRDTKQQDHPKRIVLRFSPGAWMEFVGNLKES